MTRLLAASLLALVFSAPARSQGNSQKHSGNDISDSYDLAHSGLGSRKNNADEKIFNMVWSARQEARDWIEMDVDGLRTKALNGDARAGELADKIGDERKREEQWETSAWSLSPSSLRPGENISLELGDGVVLVEGTVRTAMARGMRGFRPAQKADDPVAYEVTAPQEIRSRILMEGLRHDLGEFAAMVQFDGKDPENNGFWVSWKSAWFDAQNLFCKNNPGAKFTDLNSEEQTCRTPKSVAH